MERSTLSLSFNVESKRIVAEGVVAFGETFDVLFKEAIVEREVTLALFAEGRDTPVWVAQGTPTAEGASCRLSGLSVNTLEAYQLFKGGEPFRVAVLTVTSEEDGEVRDYGFASMRLYVGGNPDADYPSVSIIGKWPTKAELEEWLAAARALEADVAENKAAVERLTEVAATNARTAAVHAETTATLQQVAAQDAIAAQEARAQAQTAQEAAVAAEAETKAAIQRLGTVYRVKGNQPTKADLDAIADAEPGDVWNILEDGANYVWAPNAAGTGYAWDILGSVVDLTPYATTAAVEAQLDAEAQARTSGDEANANAIKDRLYAWAMDYRDNGHSPVTGHLNNQQRGGIYFCKNNDGAPSQGNGILIVANHENANTPWVVQVYMALDSAGQAGNPSRCAMFTRRLYGSEWSTWAPMGYHEVGAGLLWKDGAVKAAIDTAMPSEPEDIRMPSTKLLKSELAQKANATHTHSQYLTTETDPVYTADKPTLATQADISDLEATLWAGLTLKPADAIYSGVTPEVSVSPNVATNQACNPATVVLVVDVAETYTPSNNGHTLVRFGQWNRGSTYFRVWSENGSAYLVNSFANATHYDFSPGRHVLAMTYEKTSTSQTESRVIFDGVSAGEQTLNGMNGLNLWVPDNGGAGYDGLTFKTFIWHEALAQTDILALTELFLHGAEETTADALSSLRSQLAEHTHDNRYPVLGTAGSNVLSSAIKAIHKDSNDGSQLPILKLGSQFVGGGNTGTAMDETKWRSDIYFDKIKFLGKTGTTERTLDFRAGRETSLVTHAELDAAVENLPTADAITQLKSWVKTQGAEDNGNVEHSNINNPADTVSDITYIHEGGTAARSLSALSDDAYTKAAVQETLESTGSAHVSANTMTDGAMATVKARHVSSDTHAILSATASEAKLTLSDTTGTLTLTPTTQWPWAKISGIPDTFTPAAHTHATLTHTDGWELRYAMNLTTMIPQIVYTNGNAMGFFGSLTLPEGSGTAATQEWVNETLQSGFSASMATLQVANDDTFGLAVNDASALSEYPFFAGRFELSTGGLLQEKGLAIDDEGNVGQFDNSDLSFKPFATTEALAAKQDALTAGSGITISGNTISAIPQSPSYDPAIDAASTNAVQNRAVAAALAALQARIDALTPTTASSHTIAYHPNVSLLTVTPDENDTISLDTTNWVDGAQMFLLLTTPSTIGNLPSHVHVLSYFDFEPASTYQVIAWKIGTNLYLNPVAKEA